MTRRSGRLAIGCSALVLGLATWPVRADIYQWEWVNGKGVLQSSTLCPDGAGRSAGPQASLVSLDLTKAYLIGVDLSGADLSRAVLVDARLSGATLTGADLSDAQIAGAWFGGANGLTIAQLYSTANYKARDLSGIYLFAVDFTGINLADQSLAGARFYSGNLSNANLTNADLTGAYFSNQNLTKTKLTRANLTKACFYDGVVTDADLTDAQVSGADFRGVLGLTVAQICSTASYKARDLHDIGLVGQDLTGVSLANQNLKGARFSVGNLTNVDLSNAQIAGAWFDRAKGFTLAQLLSTASYKARDLHGINLSNQDLTGVDFGGQNLASALFQLSNLTNANLASANLTHAQLILAKLSGANLSNADLRGSDVTAAQVAGTTAVNTIRPDGTIEGLGLGPAQRLSIRDYQPRVGQADIRIKITKSAAFDPGGTLQIVLDDASWASTIGFEAGISVSLGGKLELVLGPNVSPVDLLNQHIQLFDWAGVTPSGRFDFEGVSEVKYLDQVYTLTWDTSGLYTDGRVRLVAVPEPAQGLLLGLGVVALLRRRRLGGGGVGRG